LKLWLILAIDEFTANFIKNGGVIKTIYEVSGDFRINEGGKWQVVGAEKLIDILKGAGDEGGEVKLTKKVYQNMAIFDRKVVYISLVDPTVSRYNRSDIIVKNQNFAESMAEFFEQSWQNADKPEDFRDKYLSANKG
jgi:hypothetical protein